MITGATGSTYTIDPLDTNKQLRVGVYPAAPAVAGTLLANIDPNVTSSLLGWQRIQQGTPSEVTQNFTVGVDVPVTGFVADGVTYYATVRGTADPLSTLGTVFELTTTQNARYLSGSSSHFDRCDLWQNNPAKDANNQTIFREGNEVWVHFKIMVPSSWPTAAVVSGGWTNCYQQHTSINAGSNAASGVCVNMRNTDPATWWFNVPGGPTGAGNIYDGASAVAMVTQRQDTVIQYDHWYDFLIHQIVSTTDTTGFTQFYLDGVLQTPSNTTILQGASYWDSVRQGWAKANLSISGSTVDQPNYEFSNYHTHITSNASLYYSRIAIGTTQTSVAF